MPISLASTATAPRILSASAASARSASGRPSATPSVGIVVKVGLQNELRGDLIAYALVRARFHTGIGQRRSGGASGEAFVDQLRRDAETAPQLPRETGRTRGQGMRRT